MSENLTALEKLLNNVRGQATDEYGNSVVAKQRDKGTVFENLTKLFLENDKTQSAEYTKVYTYAEWAKLQGIPANDTGIDLVAINKENETVAIQCKFYASDYVIQKKDLDSFMNASGKEPFAHRLFVDSTRTDWSKNAEQSIDNQQIPVTRLSITTMETSSVDWSQYNEKDNTVKTFDNHKDLRDYQEKALNKVRQHFTEHDRGKLIMACGTGKTLTSLRIAEQQTGVGKRVLYLVPSLALMQQTITEWFNDAHVPIHGFSVCSDNTIGKNKDDSADISLQDLAIPATTKADKIAQQVKSAPSDKMVVVFSTYHSIQTVSDAQTNHDMGSFDLVICDEAHRTTGATLADKDESDFVKVHNNDVIQADKRLYMTATPRVYGETSKAKAGQDNAVLASMDDTDLYGDVIYIVNFNDAVEKGSLCDYKVIVLALDEKSVDASFQRLFTDTKNYELNLEDTTKLVGCYKALCKLGLKSDETIDRTPMKRAVAFCENIKKSKAITKSFPLVAQEYKEQVDDHADAPLTIDMKHIDGTFKADQRKTELNWLKGEPPQLDGTCRILSNARCLSEGVDVPTLDAVMFLHPRKSMVDVVQAVGRVMRNAPNKTTGYVILPVTIPAGMKPEEALDNNKKYKVVWDVLNALRSHDERLGSTINRGSLGGGISDRIEIIPITNALPPKSQPTTGSLGIGSGGANGDDFIHKPNESKQLDLDFEQSANRAIMAQLVKNCGDRVHWENWATDIAKIAKTHIDRITTILNDPNNTVAKQTFDSFLKELQDDLNPSVTADDAIEMLGQHIITKPVFDTLFAGYDFAKKNPVSIAMDRVLKTIQSDSLSEETETLDRFYKSVQRRADGIKTITEKQRLIIELYDKFFKNAFPKTTQQLGIVYTPIEIVDFIIHSINDVLKDEFNTSIGAKGVDIIDPFTGTGTFVTRLLQSGLITPEQLEYKYKNEIHANEIVLLAYYIASINIEQVYHEIMNEQGDVGAYEPFKRICLTDTFQMHEGSNMILDLIPDNSERIQEQKQRDVKVIMGNPPYSAGQKSASDNAQNLSYPELDNNIADSYVKNSIAKGGNQYLYDSYIRAIRWGSDRMGDSGVMGYVSGSGYIEKPAMDGMRKCLAEEYTNLYVFNLRGDIRKNILSKGHAREGQNVFESGSMTGITITLFVKNPDAESHGNIYYHDIGDDLTTTQKLKIIKGFKSINGIDLWERITPDKYNDWINQRDDSFYDHIAMGDKKTKGKANTKAIFANYSLGFEPNSASWNYNASVSNLCETTKNAIDFYNSEVDRYQATDKSKSVKDFFNKDTTKIGYSASLELKVKRNKKFTYNDRNIRIAQFRPFGKLWTYYENSFNKSAYQLPNIFPMGTDLPNRLICVTGAGNQNGQFSVFIVDTLPDLQFMQNGQIFPQKLYTPNTGDNSLLDSTTDDYLVKDGITDYAQSHFTYENNTPTKDDIFYYIYGVLHHPDYVNKWESNLTKSLPHIPKVKTYDTFMKFSQAGRKLADLHINYESADLYPVNFIDSQGNKTATLDPLNELTDDDYRVTKMKYAGPVKEKDKTTIIYNKKITITDIPLEAYDYKVNAKSPIEWVMDRHCVKTDKKSQLTNDVNDYARETVGNAKYSLELLQRAITVSMESQKTINELPELDF